jgi:DNA (cytosine-5)-methyltransferase 1
MITHELAPTIPSRNTAGGGLGTDFDCDGGLVTHPLKGEGFDGSEDGTGQGTPLITVGPLSANGGTEKKHGFGMGQQDFESGYIIPILEAGARTGKSTTDLRAGSGIGEEGDPMFTLQSGKQHAIAFAQNTRDEVRLQGGDGQVSGALGSDEGMKQRTYIAFSSKDHGADAGDISPTLRGMGHNESHPNGGGQVAVVKGIDEEQNAVIDGFGTLKSREKGGGFEGAVAFESRLARNGRGAPAEIVPPLKAQSGESGKGDSAPLVAEAMQVRRLTPRECERLQGFPDDYTLIPYRGKPAESCPDGPRYKALGNSMAVPVMRWIGQRIQMVEEIIKGKEVTA